MLCHPRFLTAGHRPELSKVDCHGTPAAPGHQHEGEPRCREVPAVASSRTGAAGPLGGTWATTRPERGAHRRRSERCGMPGAARAAAHIRPICAARTADRRRSSVAGNRRLGARRGRCFCSRHVPSPSALNATVPSSRRWSRTGSGRCRGRPSPMRGTGRRAGHRHDRWVSPGRRGSRTGSRHRAGPGGLGTRRGRPGPPPAPPRYPPSPACRSAPVRAWSTLRPAGRAPAPAVVVSRLSGPLSTPARVEDRE